MPAADIPLSASMGPPAGTIDARSRVLWVSLWAFTTLFNVWSMVGVLGVEIKQDSALMLGADAARGMTAEQLKPAVESRFEWLLAAAILAGALPRLAFGIWADRYGGRTMMAGLLIFCSVPTYLLGQATSYGRLIACALGFGMAGNAFSVGISWNSVWFPAGRKGLALGIFGAGNVGASGTKLLVGLCPWVLTFIPAAGYLGGWIPGGWRFLPTAYAGVLLLSAALVLVVCPAPDRKPGAGRPLGDLLAPLRFVQVWRFSLYYTVVLGAYVALAAWLPSYYRQTYHVELRTAALLTALYIFPASLLRPLGGYLADRFGPRVVTYGVFITMILALVPLCLPTALLNLGVAWFTVLLVIVGAAMGIGKASVYKYVPNYYPNDVGAVGGLVGTLGALGGVLLPPAFGMIGRWTGSPQSAFITLLALAVASVSWLHLAVARLRATARGRGDLAPARPEISEITEITGLAAESS